MRKLISAAARRRGADSPAGLARAWLLPALVLLLAVLLAAAPLAAKKKDKGPGPEDALPEKYRAWLEAVELIISEEEKDIFLELDEDYQREAFIERFWEVRDPYPRTARNEYREDWNQRVAMAREAFGTPNDERWRVLMLNGFPDGRVEHTCNPYLWPVEVWYYDGSDNLGFEFLLLFYQRWGNGNFRLWEPTFGLDDLMAERGVTLGDLTRKCGEKGEAVVTAINFMMSQGNLGTQVLLARVQQQPERPDKEWITSFSTYSTEVPEDAATFEAELLIDYPGRHQSRTVLQGAVGVQTAKLKLAELGGHRSYNLMLNGELLLDGKLHDSFRYRFDFPEQEVGGEILPLVFQRYLRPASYTLIVKVEDTNADSYYRSERQIEVPRLEEAPPPAPQDPETARILAEANAAISSGENTIKIVPLRGDWQLGLVRINTLTTGDAIAKARFLLDGEPILTKKNPPYSVELDLGQVPRSRVLRVEGFDAGGEEIANDEVMLNAGQHRFAVRLVEPRRGKTYRSSLRAQADVQVPEGELVERVEFFLNETLVATVYQPPYIQPIVLPESEPIAYVRAVAFTPDGSSTEDLVFVNAPADLEEVDVDFVELYTTVLDRQKRPVEGLTQADFSVREDDAPQELVRFDLVRDLPIHVAVMLDVSASMDEEIDQAQAAALAFFEQAVTPKDRATIVTFNDHPQLATKFTNDIDALAGGLAGLTAERGTALYDSLIFTLYYFNGIKGQRAILLLSDGKDENSKFEFDDALEYAHRAGVAIYAIGLSLKGKDIEVKRKLSRIAEETGGRSFYIQEASELPAIYAAIQRELRSRYLLAYQSNNTSGSQRFRTIEVELSQSGLEAKTLRGYYP